MLCARLEEVETMPGASYQILFNALAKNSITSLILTHFLPLELPMMLFNSLLVRSGHGDTAGTRTPEKRAPLP